MDPGRIDRLATGLARAPDRRGALRLLGGAALAAAGLAAGGAGGAEAAPKIAICLDGQTHRVAKRGWRGRFPGATRGACAGPPRTVTQTFTNPAPIAINTFGSARPFFTTIRVTGLRGAAVTDVDLVLAGFGHAVPRDVDVLLVAPDGRNAFVLDDVGQGALVAGLTLRLDDEAAAPLPTGGAPLTSGTFRPTNYDDGEGLDAFDNPAPVPSGNAALAVFGGMDPDGEWRLFIRDDSASDGGQLTGGWELRITATLPGGRG
jgi:hypothetical protein